MAKEYFTFIVGGKAGQGIKKAGMIAVKVMASYGRNVFEYNDYPSLIKGGHNYCCVSSSVEPIKSHHQDAHIIFAPDKRSYDRHFHKLRQNGVMVYDSHMIREGKGVGLPFLQMAKKYSRPELRVGIASVVALAVSVGMEEEDLVQMIKTEYPSGANENAEYAHDVYTALHPIIFKRFNLKTSDKILPVVKGNDAIAMGAAAAGLDLYFSYPMTPASSILHFFSRKGKAFGIHAIHAESEIAAANMAVGATFTGARAAVGSSGGGFALMQEAFSLAGMVEAPVLFILSSRPGPSTGLSTYTSQGDLKFAIYQGHGEFPRIVASPCSAVEAYQLSADLLDMAWKFQTPAILLTEKHLSENRMTADINPESALFIREEKYFRKDYHRYEYSGSGVSPLMVPPTDEIIKWNSHEHDEFGITQEDENNAVKMHDKRKQKGKEIVKYLKTRNTVNVYGDSGPVILTYGSTTMSVLEALDYSGIEARVVQPVFLEPFPYWEFEEYKNVPIVVVELSSHSQFASHFIERTGIKPVKVFTRYDGRPFEPAEFGPRLKEALKNG